VRVPIRHIAGNLVWSTQGSVWAVYRLHPGPDAHGQREESVQGTYVPAQVRDEQLAKITHLVRSMSGAPRLFGLCAQVDPGEIALKMIEGIEPAEQVPGAGRHPWVENVEAALELLDGQEMHRRTLWLAVPLQTETGGLQVSAQLGAAWAEITPLLGMRPAPVARREVAAYREQALRVQAALAGGIAFRPARPAEIVWMIQHALHRGLTEPLLAEAETSELYGGQIRDGVLRSPSYADLGQVRLQEGGIDPELDDTGELKNAGRFTRSGRTAWWRLHTGSPLGRRWLQVETDADLRREIHGGLQVVENWNSANTVIQGREALGRGPQGAHRAVLVEHQPVRNVPPRHGQAPPPAAVRTGARPAPGGRGRRQPGGRIMRAPAPCAVGRGGSGRRSEEGAPWPVRSSREAISVTEARTSPVRPSLPIFSPAAMAPWRCLAADGRRSAARGKGYARGWPPLRRPRPDGDGVFRRPWLDRPPRGPTLHRMNFTSGKAGLGPSRRCPLRCRRCWSKNAIG
jgi:hypothetical protein